MPVHSSQIQMSTAEQFSLSDQAKSFIEKLAKIQLVNNLSLKPEPSVTEETVARRSTSVCDHFFEQSSVTRKGAQCHDVVLVTDAKA